MRDSGYKRVISDWYVEPRWAIDGLLDVESFDGTCWDPSCGAGNIPMALQARGLECCATDLVNRGYGMSGKSFFDLTSPKVDNIISNPPYHCIEYYVHHALKLTNRKVALLARLAFLEGQKRQKFFAETPLARVWVSRRRISMPPGGQNIRATGGTVAYAWFVWEHGHSGQPVIGWF